MPQITIVAPERPVDFPGEGAQWEMAGRTLHFVEVRGGAGEAAGGGVRHVPASQAQWPSACMHLAGQSTPAITTWHSCACLDVTLTASLRAALQGDVLDRHAYEKAGVARAHAVILGSLQSPDAKAADARMLTRWAFRAARMEGRRAGSGGSGGLGCSPA